jgi:hypothetical protein
MLDRLLRLFNVVSMVLILGAADTVRVFGISGGVCSVSNPLEPQAGDAVRLSGRAERLYIPANVTHRTEQRGAVV